MTSKGRGADKYDSVKHIDVTEALQSASSTEAKFGELLLSDGKEQTEVTVKLGDGVLVVTDANERMLRSVQLKDITSIFVKPKTMTLAEATRPEVFLNETATSGESALDLVVVYFPGGKLSSGPCSPGTTSRLRMELVFSSETNEHIRKWEAAITSAVAGSGQYDIQPSRVRKMLVILSPKSGSGMAEENFTKKVRPILEASRVALTIEKTKCRFDATRIIKEARLSDYDGIISVGGDGIIFEIVQGLRTHSEFTGPRLPLPIGVVPCGSGNGMHHSLMHLSPDFDPKKGDQFENAAVAIARGRAVDVDVWTTSGLDPEGKSLPEKYACLSLSWAIIGDIDIESEKYRCIGSARFTVGALERLCCLRKYKATVTYLPAESNEAIPSVQEDTPSSWVEVSPDSGFVLLWAMNVSHADGAMHVGVNTVPSNGYIDLFYVTADASRPALLQFLLGLETGSHVDLPCTKRVRVKAFRIDASYPARAIPGTLSLDGELLEPQSRIQLVTSPSAEAHFFGL